MKSRVSVIAGILAIIMLVMSTTAQARLSQNDEHPHPYIIKGVVTIVFEDDVQLDGFQKGFGMVSFALPGLDRVLSDFTVNDARKLFPWRKERPPVNSGLRDLTRFYEISFPEEIEVNDVIDALLQNPNIRTAEPVWALPLAASPNDPDFPSQWHMAPGGLDPQVYDAWDIETGSDSIKLGMIDTGVNYKHPDLKRNIWINPGEDLDGDREVFDLDDLNGVDDDGNGVIDDLIGYDFLSGIGAVWPGEDGASPDPDPNDFDGHGTHTSGIAAAANNNGTDVTGMAGGWFGGSRSFRGSRIMCIRVGATGADGNGYVNSNNCGTAIDYAASNGANVISASWGSSNTSTMVAGMQNAAASGVNVLHAAGNAACDCPDFLDLTTIMNVLSIAATDATDHISTWGGGSGSNYGSWIDVCAPGTGILSTVSNAYVPGTAVYNGTSMACPMVAGLALLIRSAMPSLSKVQVDSIIIATADNIDAINSSNCGGIPCAGKLGSGRINAFSALLDLASAKFTVDIEEGNVPLLVQFTDLSPASPDLPSNWDWDFGNGDVSTVQNPSYTYNGPGIQSVSLVTDVNNPLGPGEEHLKNYIWVRADTLRMDSVGTNSGEKIVVPVIMANTSLIKEINFAFTFQNSLGVTLDSFSVAGLRTEYFDDVVYSAQSPGNQRYVIRMRSSAIGESHYLPAGNSPILNLYFNISNSASEGLVEIDTITFNGKSPNVASVWGNYFPIYNVGKIAILPCAHGDANCDGSIDIADITTIVAFFFGGSGIGDLRGIDVNGDGSVNISDLTYLVDYLFKGGPPPPP